MPKISKKKLLEILQQNKAERKVIRKKLFEMKILTRKKISKRTGTSYIYFHDKRLANYVIRISYHPMSPVHPLLETDKVVFDVGKHKFGMTADECIEWVTERIKKL